MFDHEMGEGSDERMHESDRGGLPVKIVLVGDVAVGKTSLLVSYTTNGYPADYVPTALDEYSVFVEADQQPIKLQLVDTAGQEEFRNLRQLCYTKADVILLCFSVVMPSSLRNCADRWLREIADKLLRDQRPLPPLLLIGTQIDRRSDAKITLQLQRTGEQPVSEAEGQRVAAQIGAQQYLECSALTQRHLKLVFDEAVLAALRQKCKNHIVASLMLNKPHAVDSSMSLFPRLSPRTSRKLMSKTTKPTSTPRITTIPGIAATSTSATVGGGLGKSSSNNSGMTSSTRASVSSASHSGSASGGGGPDLVHVNQQFAIVDPSSNGNNKKSDYSSSLSPVLERKYDPSPQHPTVASPTLLPVIHHHQLHDDGEYRRRSRRWKKLLCCAYVQ